MPFVDTSRGPLVSDFIVNETELPGYARESINVTPPAAGAALKAGTVVFRTKGTNPAGAYAPIAAAADIALTNEYAIVMGNHYSFNPSFVPNAIQANEFNAVAIKRGPIIMKEYYIKKIATDVAGAALTAAEFETLKEVLKVQGIVLEITL